MILCAGVTILLDHVRDLPGVEFMPINEWDEPNCWLSCILLNGEVTPLQIMEALEVENIESRPIWKPMHLQPVYEKGDYVTADEGTSVSDDIFARGVCLPSDTKMTDADLERVTGIIRGVRAHKQVVRVV